MSWQEYLPENFKETYDYSAKIWRSGLASFPPLIVTCAITGGNAGTEVLVFGRIAGGSAAQYGNLPQ